MQLVKRGLAQQDHELRFRHLDGAPKGVEVEKAAAGRIEALLHAAERFRHLAPQK